MPSNKIEKIPLKQAEVAVNRFNEQAIPHHLGLLKNHRSNIEKSLALGNWSKIKKEEINAARVIKQLKNLLLEMDTLREKVREDDVARFDAMMEVGKKRAFEEMREFVELQLRSPTSTLPSSQSDEDLSDPLTRPIEIGNTMAHQQTLPQIESNYQHEEHQLAQRQACLDELEELQHEIRDLNGMFNQMGALVQVQAESVQIITDNAEEALENVQAGESNLRRALTYKKAMYPVVGALLGTCIGGPIGLVAGLKAGGLAAVGCGILGFTGGSVLKDSPSVNVVNDNIEDGQTSSNEQEEELEMEKKDE